MDPSFDCNAEDYRTMDRVRLFKQLGLGQRSDDTPAVFADLDLELVTDREAEG